MIPVAVELENFRSFAGRQRIPLDFAPLFCIVGPNGAGKSSIVEAMLWALFGKSPRVARGESPMRQGALFVWVVFDFVVDKTHYRVARRYDHTGRTELQFLRYDPDLQDFAPVVATRSLRQIQSAVEKTLGADFDGLRVATVFMQNEASLFSTLQPAERRRQLARLLGIERYEKIHQKVREKFRALKTEVDVWRDQLQQVKSKLADISDPGEELSAVESQIAEIDREIEQLRTRQMELERTRTELVSAENQAQSLQKSLASNRTTIDHLRGEAAALERDLAHFEKIFARQDEITAGFAELQKLRTELARLDAYARRRGELLTRITNLRQQISEAEKSHAQQVSRMTGEIEHLREVIAQLEKSTARREEVAEKVKELELNERTLEQLMVQQREYEQLQREISRAESEIDTEARAIKRSIEEKSRQLRDIEEKLAGKEKISAELSALSEQIAKLEDSRRRGEVLSRRLTEIKSQLDQIRRQKAELTAQLDERQRQFDTVRRARIPRCPLCGSELTGEHRRQLLAKLSAEIDDLRARMDQSAQTAVQLREEKERLEQEIAALPSEEDIEKLRRRRRELESQLAVFDELSQNARRLVEEVESLKGKLAAGDFAGSARRKLEKFARRAEELSAAVETLEVIREKIRQLAPYRQELAVIEKDLRQLALSRKKLADLTEKLTALEKTPVAQDLRRDLASLERELDSLDYDQRRHADISRRVEEFAHFEPEKLELNRAAQEAPKIRRRLDQIRGEVERLSAENARIERQIKSLREKIAQLPEVERKILSLGDEIAQLRIRRDELDSRRRSLEARLNLYREYSEAKKSLEGKIRTSERELSVISALDEILGLNGIQDWLLRGYLDAIQEYANQILEALTDRDLEVLLSPDGDDKLYVRVRDELGERRYESYSGGEEFRIDFALRLAISRILAERSGFPLQTLIIDEGFGSQDSDGLHRLVDMLYQVQDQFDRIIVISHLDQIKESFPARLEVSRAGGSSVVRMVRG